jgi:hypothetical protein
VESVVILLPLLIGLIPAAIANNKGRSFVGWWIFGTLLFIVALPVALVMKSSDLADGYACPNCAEMVKVEALSCPFCGFDLETLRLPGRAGTRHRRPALLEPALRSGLPRRLAGADSSWPIRGPRSDR